MPEYTVRINKLDGTLGCFLFGEADNPEHMIEKVKADKFMVDGWLDKYELSDKWKIKHNVRIIQPSIF